MRASTTVAPHRDVDAAIAQDPADAGRDVDIGLAPAVDHHRQLVVGLPVEDRDQPLEGIELNGAFGGNPIRAARATGIGAAMRDIEDHRVRQLSDATDRRPGLGLRHAAGQKRDAENNGLPEICGHDDRL
ncbi:hypothetical protein [Bradyrhizobium genosp. P]|uniref:hypothetical protein n=1 Tax=Bradyrhizobium genosp. P TaxID=83641 RepID=UPI003CF462FC